MGRGAILSLLACVRLCAMLLPQKLTLSLPHFTPPPKTHTQIQTETYLEVLTDRAPEEEIGVQTEARMDVPTAPLFVPAPVSFSFIYIYLIAL